MHGCEDHRGAHISPAAAATLIPAGWLVAMASELELAYADRGWSVAFSVHTDDGVGTSRYCQGVLSRIARCELGLHSTRAQWRSADLSPE